MQDCSIRADAFLAPDWLGVTPRDVSRGGDRRGVNCRGSEEAEERNDTAELEGLHV